MHLRTTTLVKGVDSRRSALQKERKVYRNNGTRRHPQRDDQRVRSFRT